MGEIKRFTPYGNRIKRDGTLLNINFETKTDAKLCCKLLNQMDKDQQEYIDELNEIFEWHKEHYGKSILDERLEFKSDCEKENEQLKQKIKELEHKLENWKQLACVAQSENSILHNELGIAIEQGYALSDAFKEYTKRKW